MQTVVGVVAAVLGVSLLIVIHEAGHYLVARAFGMKVSRFSVGFGKVLFSVKRAGTEFAVSALPIGGYVHIVGMAPGEEIDPSDHSLYCNQAAWRRFLVILAGPAMNYVLAVVLAFALLQGAGLGTPDRSSSVGRIQAGSPAERAGLQRGDHVLAVDDRPVATWDELVREIQAHPGQELALRVERADDATRVRQLSLQLTPRDDGGVGRAGFGMHTARTRSEGGGAALLDSFRRTNEVAWNQVAAFGKVFSRGKGGGSTTLIGPLGLLREFVLAWLDGPAPFADFLWMISVVLAVLNLLPIPPLDGCRLLFLGYEVVTRRRVNAKVESAILMAGVTALIVLVVGVTVFTDLGVGKLLSGGGR